MNRDLFGVFLDAYIGIAELDLDLGIRTIIQCIPMPDMALRSFQWGGWWDIYAATSFITGTGIYLQEPFL